MELDSEDRQVDVTLTIDRYRSMCEGWSSGICSGVFLICRPVKTSSQALFRCDYSECFERGTFKELEECRVASWVGTDQQRLMNEIIRVRRAHATGKPDSSVEFLGSSA